MGRIRINKDPSGKDDNDYDNDNDDDIDLVDNTENSLVPNNTSTSPLSAVVVVLFNQLHEIQPAEVHRGSSLK